LPLGVCEHHLAVIGSMQMRVPLVVTVLALAGLTLVTQPAHAQTCQELWVERNAYYNAFGYCFATVRGTSYFGSEGCEERSQDRVRAKFSHFISRRVDSLRRERTRRSAAKTRPKARAWQRPHATSFGLSAMHITRHSVTASGAHARATILG
jgi:hypothetical protein